MEFVKLLLGVGLIIIFSWISLKDINRNKARRRTRSGLLNFIISLERVAYIVVGLYLVITSAQSLI